MSIEKMKFVKASGPISKLDEFISTCCLSGDFHPEPASQHLSASLGYTSFNEENPHAALLHRIEELAKKSNSELQLELIDGIDAAVPDEDSSDYIEKLDQRMSTLSTQRKNLEDQLLTCRNGIDRFAHFLGFGVDLGEISGCEFIVMRFGHLPKEGYEKLQLYSDNPYLLFIPCSSDSVDYWGVYCAPRDRIEEIDGIFASLHFEMFEIPCAVGTAEEIIEQLQNNIGIIENQLDELNREAVKSWNDNSRRCKEIYTQLVNLDTVFELRRYASHSTKFFVFTGYIPESAEKLFSEKAHTVSDIVCEIGNPDKSDRASVPVKLKNPFFFKPYEYFVEMYGLPSYTDIDVTGFVAITYTLLFGIMFGDLGQGLVLFALGLLGWKLKKIQLARILVPCGLSSAVFGFVFGSVFGYEQALNPVYKALGMNGKPLSVMESINTVLLLAIGIGVALVTVAMLINVFACIKRKSFGEALFSNNGLAGIAFYLAAVSFAVSFMNGPQFIPNTVAFIIMGVCAVILFLKEMLIGIVDKKPGWKDSSVSDFLMQNLFEFIEYVLSYFSNTVSFLRVGAFVIVHASMMLVVFTLGGQGHNIPVIIIGNIVVIALEGLLTGIQGLRLEFYEMFSRFYEGGGKPFRSFAPDSLKKNRQSAGANVKN